MHSPRHHQCFPCHIAGFIRNKETHSPSHLSGSAKPSERDSLQNLVSDVIILSQRCRKLGPDQLETDQ